MTDHPVLSHLARFGIHLGLDRIKDFLAALGSPHRKVPVIHVGGTNGKGSVVRMVGSVLRAAGYRVGEYTSPHLQQVNERIHVDGQPISDDDLSALLYELDEARRGWARSELGDEVSEDRVLTYFELMTAAAFVHFARTGVDVVVLEVGLGGRLDATNVVQSLVSAIVSVGLDHCDRLGPDLASIAAEKAGIIKPGTTVVVGALAPDARSVVRSIAAHQGARLIEPETGYRVSGRPGKFTWSMGDAAYRDLSIPLNGDHQLLNAGVALAVLHSLPATLALHDDAVRLGLASTSNPGRMEWLAPDLLVDGAHNPDGAMRLADYLRQLEPGRRTTLLLGASSDKDVRSMVATLGPCVDRVWTTCCSHPRAIAPGDLARALVDVGVPMMPAGPIEEALPLAREGGGLVVVAGSLFLVGAVRELTRAG